MSMFRIVSGPGPHASTASAQDILSLALKLASAARELGLAVVSIKASHSLGSASRYVTLRDGGKRHWLLRVSNHRMPVNSDHAAPHLDFVSLDGVSGLQDAAQFLHRVAMGEAIWADAADPARRAVHKRNRQRNRQIKGHRK